MENFRVVKENVTLKEIREVCKKAYIDEYIMSLPNQYETIIGEGGVNLSGGQKQRIAIARTLLLNTKIILFDEATSALDNETQKDIQIAINNLKGKYTILMIAHRLSTIKNADRILFVFDGRILMEGTHDELMNSCEEYKKLYEAESIKE
jgi:ABC-type multidrug transport system fused ATPase/permease subunit